jgi:REP element-mobilizing transposase RayT
VIKQRRDEALAPSESALRQRTRPRLPDFDYKGEYAYHIILSTKDRKPVFHDLAFGKLAASILAKVASNLAFQILTYCFMPDHCHLLVHKQVQGSMLWQQSFFDRALRRDEDLRIVNEYIISNPVHAGLSENAASYPLSGGEFNRRAVLTDGAEASSLRVFSDD